MMRKILRSTKETIRFGWERLLQKYKDNHTIYKNEINSGQISEMILILLLSLKSGSTLDQSIKNAIPSHFQSPGLQGIESIQRTAKRLNNKDFYRLTMLLNQYHKNGSESTFQALQKFHDELCFHQTAEIKKKAEQATIKLTLLLMLSLVSIILMIMAPVMMMLKN